LPLSLCSRLSSF